MDITSVIAMNVYIFNPRRVLWKRESKNVFWLENALMSYEDKLDNILAPNEKNTKQSPLQMRIVFGFFPA